jgi:hypothetical protein
MVTGDKADGAWSWLLTSIQCQSGTLLTLPHTSSRRSS